MSNKEKPKQQAQFPAPNTGERYAYRIRPVRSGGPGDEPAGSAYVFALPFDIHVDPSVDTPAACRVAGSTVTVYPPFRSDELTGCEVPQVSVARLPYRPGTEPPTGDKLFQESFTVDRRLRPDLILANAIRLDIVPYQESDFAAGLVMSALSLMRWWTRQWWINRDRRYAEDLLRNGFWINRAGERVSGVYSYATAYGRFGIERPLEKISFDGVVSGLGAGLSTPLYMDTLFDAIYFHSIGELRRSIMDAATTCESARDITVEKLSAKGRVSQRDVRRAFSGTDLLRHLDTGFAAISGQSFRAARPDDYEYVRYLWVARGHVAHGKPGVASFPGGARPVTAKDQTRIIQAVFALVEWVERLGV